MQKNAIKPSQQATTPKGPATSASDDALSTLMKEPQKKHAPQRPHEFFSFISEHIAASPLTEAPPLTKDEEDTLDKLLKAPGILKPHYPIQPPPASDPPPSKPKSNKK